MVTFISIAQNTFFAPYINEEEDSGLTKEYFENALKAFQECEILLPPGVETLTNMGILLSELGQEEMARIYVDSAINLNRDYEYAYFRKAESWRKEKQNDKVLETLRSFRKVKTPTIGGFVKLYKEYATDLALG